MKKAFTLIELLVVIAIIAILAAILFPVFAQAKTAAKKTASISNEKQIGLSILMYAGDYDDMYPRNDDCINHASLNSALVNMPYDPNGVGCVSAPFYFRKNHYSWQWWLQPYVKNVDIFFHPAIGKYDPPDSSCPGGEWTTCGEIVGSYALNLSLTGALNTYHRADTANGRFRNSFLGGTQTAIPDIAGTMMLVELVDPTINFAPVFVTPNAPTQTAYPLAIREAWAPYFYKTDFNTCTVSNVVDNANVPFAGSINLGYADGHVHSLKAQAFLGQTPSAADYAVSSRPACGLGSGSWTLNAAPVWTQPWPLWGLD